MFAAVASAAGQSVYSAIKLGEYREERW